MNLSYVQLLFVVTGIIIFNAITFYHFSPTQIQQTPITITQTLCPNDESESVQILTNTLNNQTVDEEHTTSQKENLLPDNEVLTNTPTQNSHTQTQTQTQIQIRDDAQLLPTTHSQSQTPPDSVNLSLTTRLKPSHRQAFVTMCTANYWKACATLIQSFRDHSHNGMDTEFIVAVLPIDQPTESKNVGTIGWRSGTMPKEADSCFQKLNATVRYIEKLPLPSTFKVKDVSWKIAWNKLRIWEWEEYEKLVYLDSDILVNSAVDEMMDFPDFSSSPGQCNPCEFQYKMNGGVLVLKPNVTILTDMLHYGETTPRQDGWYLSEQMLLREYFLWGDEAQKGERPIYGHLIDSLYNQMMGSCRCLGEAVRHVKLWHFYCSNKPWSIPESEWAMKKRDAPRDCVNDIALRWYETMKRSTTNCNT